VASALARRGHRIRALARRDLTGCGQTPWTDVYKADLRWDPLEQAFEEVDMLIHLAARVRGSYRDHMADTVVGTERLLEAMAGSATRRLILASSLTVYDWAVLRGDLTEESALEGDLYQRDAYAIAKTWQERVVRRLSQQRQWDLAVLRPGYIWGPAREYFPGLGHAFGSWHFVFGPTMSLPLTYVENCADCFAAVVDKPQALGQTFNVVDGHDVSPWRYLGATRDRGKTNGRRIPVPYHLPLTAARVAQWANRRFCHGNAQLPGLLVPGRFLSRFVPAPVSTHKLREVLEWRPPFDFGQCLLRASEAEVP
jgi:nucleoside-diphosphate-sugar epimerase